MDIVQILLSNFDAKVLKEPRGFMKVLQFFFTICAFATTTSFSSILKISVKCNDKVENIVVPIYYSFKLGQFDSSVCANQTISFLQDFSSDSRFFVSVGVLAFLFTIGILSFYLIFDPIYLKDARIPTLDFVFHVIFAVLFLAGSSAWANSLNGLKTATSLDTIVAENHNTCSLYDCHVTQEPDFTKLNISIILGFLNLFLFASNLWFIYKETTFFASKAEHPMTAPDIDHRIPTPRV